MYVSGIVLAAIEPIWCVSTLKKVYSYLRRRKILFNNLQAYLLKKLIYGVSSSVINARGKPIKLSDYQIGKLLFKIGKNFFKKMKKHNHKRSIDKFGY